MPKPTPVQPAASPSLLLPFALVGLCGVALGIIGTVIVLRPQLQSRAATAPAGPAAATEALPPAGLTAGMTPAQADRTLGNFYYDQSNWSQAIRHYESAIQQGSDDADIRTDLGNTYRFTGRTDDALAQYKRAQEMNPQHEFSLFNQGGLYDEVLHDHAKAEAVWKEYLARFPNGRNAALARKLLAAAGTAAPAAPGAAPTTDATEEKLLQLINKPQETKKP